MLKTVLSDNDLTRVRATWEPIAGMVTFNYMISRTKS